MATVSRAEVLLSVQRALLGEVTANLEAVATAWTDASIEIRFFYRTHPDDDDREAADDTLTEVVADFPKCEVSSTAQIWNAADPLSEDAAWVFMRKH